MTSHPTWEKLSEYADGVLESSSASETAEHVATCLDCRDTVERVRRIVAIAPALREAEPPVDGWDGVRDAILLRKLLPFPDLADRPARSSHSEPRTWRSRRTSMAGAAVAAAVVLIVASSSATMFLMRQSDNAKAMDVAAAAGAGADGALRPDLAVVEAGYLLTVHELAGALELSRSRLSPATVRAVEQSLIVIDAAIAEVRTALLADPESGLLRDILARHYVQKIDLLRRAAERAPAV